jgi:acetyl-CoA synthetase
VGRRSRKKKKRLKKFSKSKKSRKFKRKIKKAKKPRKFSKKNLSLKDDDGNTVFPVTDRWAKQALVNSSKYKKKYNLSIKENDKFWKKEGKRISWIKPYSKIKDVKYSKEEVKIKWYFKFCGFLG